MAEAGEVVEGVSQAPVETETVSAAPVETTVVETPEQIAAAAEAKRNQRFSQVMRERDIATRRAEEAERTAALALEALQRAGGTTKAEENVDKDPKPVAPKFTNDPDKFAEEMATYTENLVEWSARRHVEAATAARQKAEETRRQNDEAGRIEADYAVHRQKALTEFPDFEEIAENPNLQVSPHMAAAMKSLGAAAPKILYHLGQNEAEAARIAKLPPGQQYMEIGALNTKLASATVKPKALPEPIKPQGSGRTITRTLQDVGNSDEPGSMEEYATQRKEQIRAAKVR